MALHIDYYASLNSPWTHLGAARIEALAAKHGASLRIWPVDFGAIFPASDPNTLVRVMLYQETLTNQPAGTIIVCLS